MSENESAASEPAADELESDSVFDFLYHDVRRVGSFLAQFDDAGHLQQIIQSEGAARGSKRGWKAAAGGSLPGVGSLNVSAERGPEKGGFTASERVYDPLWVNAREILDYLTVRDMIQRDLAKASIGQFVLVSGTLLVLDMPVLKAAWSMPAVQRLLKAGMQQQAQPTGNREQRRAQGQQGSNKQATDELDLAVSLLSVIPHILQCRVVGNGVDAWCSLDEQSVVGKTSDLTLKHGTLVQGAWSVLGVLDALPDQGAVLNADLASAVNDVVATPLGQLSARFAPAARFLLGRPDHAYGLTPLLIFRQLGGGGGDHSPEPG